MNIKVIFGLIIPVLMYSVSCSRSYSGKDRFSFVWDVPIPPSLVIIRTLENDNGSFAVFAKLPKGDFEIFKKSTTRYTKWNQIKSGMTFEIGNKELRAPSDISGVYAVGETFKGTVKVVVWDEKSETVAIMRCTGIM